MAFHGNSQAGKGFGPYMHERDYASHSSGFLRTLLSVLGLIFVVVMLSWGLRTFVFQAYEIPSGSMEETIMPGDMVFSEKITYYGSSPVPGDIVTFEDPDPLSSGRLLIKRVIAVGGQTVDLRDGRVYVDDVLQDEPYTRGEPSYALTPMAGIDISYPYTVPEGRIWVMGDNRTNSQDSRFFGAVRESSVTGRAIFIYWPLSNLGPL